MGIAVDKHLLQDRQEIVDKPIQDKTGGKIEKHERENYRQKHHYFSLSRVGCGRRELLLEKHRGSHE